jgi:hypothetical protein
MRKEVKMKSYRKTAIFVGIFFLIGYVILLPGGYLVDSILDAPDYLNIISVNIPRVITGMLLEFINAAAVVGIAVLMFPLLKKQNEALALGYVGSRAVEAALLLVGHIFLLLLLVLSQEYVKAGDPATSYFQTLGTLLIAERGLTFRLVMIVVSLGALMFYYLLYQSSLIPRFISIWGLIGAPLSLAGGLIAIFGYRAGASMPTSTMILGLPIMLNEILLGILLIVKGFNPSAIASQSAKQKKTG